MKKHIPPFKRSNNSLSSDLHEIQKQEMIALGWWKGQFQKYLGKVAGKIWVGGVLCYEPTIWIGSASCQATEPRLYSAINNGEIYDESSLVDSLKNVEDGSFKITVNDIDYEITGLDFTNIETALDIATIINAKLETCNIQVRTITEEIPVYLDDGVTIKVDEFGAKVTTDVYHKHLDIRTNSRGSLASISNVTKASQGTFVGDLLLLNKSITDGRTIGNSVYGRDMRKFLKTLGYTENNIKQLCEDNMNSDVKDIKLEWLLKYERERSDFIEVLDIIRKELELVSKVEVFNYCISYDKAKYDEPYEPKSVHEEYDGLPEFSSVPNYKDGIVCSDDPDIGCYPGRVRSYDEETKPEEPDGIIYKWSGDLDVNTQRIICYNADGDDITSTIDSFLLVVLKTILYINGADLYTYDGKETVSSQDFSFKGVDYANVTTKETYIGPIKKSFCNSYNKYLTTDKVVELPFFVDDGFGNEVKKTRPYNSSFLEYFWKYRGMHDTYQRGELHAGLFYRPTPLLNLNSWLGYNSRLQTQTMITVEGLKAIAPKELQMQISKHIDIAPVYKEKKCSGFFGCFFEALIGLIVGILTAISRLLYALPIIKQVMQVVIWVLSGGNWVTTEQEFVASSNIIIATIIAIVVDVISLGTASPAMQAFIVAIMAYSIYSAHENLKSLRESFEFKEKLDALSEKEQELVNQHLDKAEEAIDLGDGQVDESKFMPLDEQMKKIEKDHFGTDSTYTIKYK